MWFPKLRFVVAGSIAAIVVLLAGATAATLMAEAHASAEGQAKVNSTTSMYGQVYQLTGQMQWKQEIAEYTTG